MCSETSRASCALSKRTAFLDLEEALLKSQQRRAHTLLDFVRIPSVSALPEHHPDVHRAAEWLVAKMRELGATGVTTINEGGLPLVLGHVHEAPDAPTLIVYGHYDVQPGGLESEWETRPFEPVLRDGEFIGRGVADRKGQIIMYLSALEALRSVGRSPDVNLTFIFDGEEEIGSPTLSNWLEGNPDLPQADCLMVGEMGFYEGNSPSITTSMRGIVSVVIEATMGPRDLLAGNYSGVIQNPANALAHILALLVDTKGRLTIPHIYEDVATTTDSERADLAAIPFDEEAFLTSISVSSIMGDTGWSVPEARALLPALDINGLWSGYTGAGPRAMIPATAHAKVSIRLVPNQEPERVLALLRKYLEDVKPSGISVQIDVERIAWPSTLPQEHPVLAAASEALRVVYGKDPYLIRNGGTLPVLSLLERSLHVPVLLLGFMQPQTNEHGPNEKFLQENFESGTRAILRLWENLPQHLTSAN